MQTCVFVRSGFSFDIFIFSCSAHSLCTFLLREIKYFAFKTCTNRDATHFSFPCNVFFSACSSYSLISFLQLFLFFLILDYYVIWFLSFFGVTSINVRPGKDAHFHLYKQIKNDVTNKLRTRETNTIWNRNIHIHAHVRKYHLWIYSMTRMFDSVVPSPPSPKMSCYFCFLIRFFFLC